MEKAQVLHVDAMCNECGNCKVFCPYESAPYLDKFTLFASEADFNDSKNDGFYVISPDPQAPVCGVRFLGVASVWKKGEASGIVQGLQDFMMAVLTDYPYLIQSDK